MASSDTAVAENPRAVIGGNNPPRSEVLRDAHAELLAQIDAIAGRANELPKEIKSDEELEAIVTVVKSAREIGKLCEETRKSAVEPFLTGQRETNGFFKPVAERLDRIIDVLGQRVTAFNREKEAAERRRLAEEHERAEAEARRRTQEAADANVGSVSREIAEREAEEAAAEAERLRRQATASSADMTRTRTGVGTVSSRTSYTAEVVDFEKVDLNRMRSVISVSDVEKIAKAFARKNRDTVAVKGVRFYPETKASIR